MQNFEEYEELFSKEPERIEKVDKQGPLDALKEVKSKIYSQIDSLDKKLGSEGVKTEGMKTAKICLKKKTIKE